MVYFLCLPFTVMPFELEFFKFLYYTEHVFNYSAFVFVMMVSLYPGKLI